jgi:hypothetical protein
MSIDVYLGTAKHGIRVYSDQRQLTPSRISGVASTYLIDKTLDVAIRAHEPPYERHLAEM